MTSISPTRFVARPTRGSARSRPPAGHPPTRSSGETLAPAARAERVGSADFGPLAAYLRDQAVTDLFINGPNDLWFDRGEGLARDATWSCPGEAELRQLAVRLIALGGRHIDEANPCVDVRLHDGVRLHAVLPPAAPHGTLLSIRIPPVSRLRLVDLEARGFFGGAVSLELVRAEVRARSNILITGAGGSGKTTLLSALLSAAPADERIVAIEDVAELRVEHPHFVSLEARQANIEGAGEISLQRLVREALRMRPDRLVLGECRGPEIRELLSALNTGHDGGAGTLHANSLADVAARLEALGALAGLTPEAMARQAVSAIQTVFHIVRSGARRQLEQVGHFALDDRGRLEVREGVGPHRRPDSASMHAASYPGGSALGTNAYDIGEGRMSGGRHV
ncbi:MAG: type II/type pathway secretion protein [Subtercola sp.]|nr:type II/type pathway secretion protein [Subtercola sp.]